MANSRDRCGFKKSTLYFLTSSKSLKDLLQFKELILKSCEVIVQKRTWAEEAAVKQISTSQLGNAGGSTCKEIDAQTSDRGLSMFI